MSLNAFHGVRMVREAATFWDALTDDVRAAIIRTCPQPVRDDPMATVDDWGVAVILLAKPREDFRAAAERVALYVTLHAERYHVTPSLNRLVRAAQATTT